MTICRFCRFCCRLLKSILPVSKFIYFRKHTRLESDAPILYITANDRNLPEHPTQIRRCGHWHKHSSECAKGTLDGIRLICKTNMAGCGWCIRRILECTISLLILENGIPTCLCTISLKKNEIGLHKRGFCSPFPLFFRVLVHR